MYVGLHVLTVLIIKQHDALMSEIYFWNRTLRVSDSFCVHHQEFSTVHIATGIGHTGFADCLLASSQQNLHDARSSECQKCTHSLTTNLRSHRIGYKSRLVQLVLRNSS